MAISAVQPTPRWHIDAQALDVLESFFSCEQFPNVEARKQLGHDLNVSPRQIQVWFQNRRQRERKRREKSGLSSLAGSSSSLGGSSRATISLDVSSKDVSCVIGDLEDDEPEDTGQDPLDCSRPGIPLAPEPKLPSNDDYSEARMGVRTSSMGSPLFPPRGRVAAKRQHDDPSKQPSSPPSPIAHGLTSFKAAAQDGSASDEKDSALPADAPTVSDDCSADFEEESSVAILRQDSNVSTSTFRSASTTSAPHLRTSDFTNVAPAADSGEYDWQKAAQALGVSSGGGGLPRLRSFETFVGGFSCLTSKLGLTAGLGGDATAAGCTLGAINATDPLAAALGGARLCSGTAASDMARRAFGKDGNTPADYLRSYVKQLATAGQPAATSAAAEPIMDEAMPSVAARLAAQCQVELLGRTLKQFGGIVQVGNCPSTLARAPCPWRASCPLEHTPQLCATCAWSPLGSPPAPPFSPPFPPLGL